MLKILLFLLVSFSVLAESVSVFKASEARKLPKNLFSHLSYRLGPVIPGLKDGYVPQGLAYSKRKNVFCISHYSDSKEASILSFLGAKSNKLLSVKRLKESSQRYLKGHVGGVALSDKNIYVASGGWVYKYLYSKKPDLIPVHKFSAETNASFCTFHNGTLFVGEFVYGSKYPSKETHHVKDRVGKNKYALICGYTKESQGKPAFAISIRQKVQGITLTDDTFYLSVSYGRANSSKIASYRNPLKEKPHGKIKLAGRHVPLWYLDGLNHIKTINFPPMSEGIAIVGSELAVLTESGANKYQKGGKGPVDNIILLEDLLQAK